MKNGPMEIKPNTTSAIANLSGLLSVITPFSGGKIMDLLYLQLIGTGLP